MLKVFKNVQLKIPDAKLIIAGRNIETGFIGVINKGTVSENQLKELCKNS